LNGTPSRLLDGQLIYPDLGQSLSLRTPALSTVQKSWLTWFLL